MNSTPWSEFIDAPPCTALQQAGVADRSHSSGGINLRELDGIALLRLRSLLEFNTLESALAACGIVLPGKVNDCSGQDPAVMCQAPRDWLLISERSSARQLLEQLQPALNAQHTIALDLTSALAVFRISGSAAPWLLSKLCGLDVHAGIRTDPHAARTRMQHAAVTLHYHAGEGLASLPVFDLIFDRYYAAYLWQLLVASIPHAEQLSQLYGSRA
jgi:heterotetrameric sarcosine oxidase gamma subunit